MVRLKAALEYNYNLQKQISIPYGAIKSISYIYLINIEITFQFLMVRLKVNQKRRLKAREHISIPYGAIKRGGNYE